MISSRNHFRPQVTENIFLYSINGNKTPLDEREREPDNFIHISTHDTNTYQIQTTPEVHEDALENTHVINQKLRN